MHKYQSSYLSVIIKMDRPYTNIKGKFSIFQICIELYIASQILQVPPRHFKNRQKMKQFFNYDFAKFKTNSKQEQISHSMFGASLHLTASS